MRKQSIAVTMAFIAMFTCLNATANENVTNKGELGQKPIPQKVHYAKKFNPENAKKRMIEFEQKLQLTDAQKEQIKKNHEKRKKIIEQEKKLQEQKRAIMEENKKQFEAILTNEQKEILKKMQEERMQKIKEFKDKQGKKGPHQGDIKRPTPVKPIPETK